MRLAQKTIVAGALLLDRVANSNLNPEGLCGSYVYFSRRRVGAQEIALWCFHFSVRRQARKTEDVALVTGPVAETAGKIVQ